MLKYRANNNILNTYYSECDVHISGERVTVREFTFLEGLRAAHMSQMLLADLAALFREVRTSPGFFALAGVFSEHEKELFGLVSMATGRDTAWLKGLTKNEEQQLLRAFWAVNWPFFVNRLAYQFR